jgi:REP element-mobilizing transposase RayT
MPTWLLTNTTYGSWLPGDRRGSVTSVRDLRSGDDPGTTVRIEHDIPGEPVEEPIPGLEASARNRMKGPPIYLDREKAEVACAQFRETAAYRKWPLLAAAIMYNHFHLVVEAPDDPHPRKLLADFKAYGTRALNRTYGTPPSETWWTCNGSRRKLKDAAALAAAINYVLRKQPNPLVLWSPDEPESDQPGAPATGASPVAGAPGS